MNSMSWFRNHSYVLKDPEQHDLVCSAWRNQDNGRTLPLLPWMPQCFLPVSQRAERSWSLPLPITEMDVLPPHHNWGHSPWWQSTEPVQITPYTDTWHITYPEVFIIGVHDFNILTSGRSGSSYFKYVISKYISLANHVYFHEIAAHVNARGRVWWSVNIASKNGLMPSSNKPFPLPILTMFCDGFMQSPRANDLRVNKSIL